MCEKSDLSFITDFLLIYQDEIHAFIDSCLASGIRRVSMFDPFGELEKISRKLKIIAKTKVLLVKHFIFFIECLHIYRIYSLLCRKLSAGNSNTCS